LHTYQNANTWSIMISNRGTSPSGARQLHIPADGHICLGFTHPRIHQDFGAASPPSPKLRRDKQKTA